MPTPMPAEPTPPEPMPAAADIPDRLALLDRACASLARGRPEMPDAMYHSPVRRYIDPARLAAEQRLIRRYPQMAAASAEIPAPGDWLARDISGVPVLLVRDADGRVNALLNACRHRGVRVTEAGCGSGRRSFTCPYHAWTYGADGALKSVPKAFGFPDLDKATRGLRRLAVAECGGLIWVATDADHAGVDIRAHLGTVGDDLEALGFASHVPYAPRELPLTCDWKLVLDGSFEAYHFKIAHKATIAPMFADNLQVIDEFGLNRRLYLVKAALDPTAPPRPEDFTTRGFGNIFYFVFPNTLILVQPDHAQVTRVEPAGVGASVLHDVALVPEVPATPKALHHWQRNIDIYRAALGEDYVLAESTQSTLTTGANDTLIFGGFEFAAARFHDQLEAELAAMASG
ncbi:(2Fe-2S) ferredoxin [Tistrella bauzanensis]|uniref:(2Fe-2S) ferredoxin n=1 Tax=Tistrella bauzanensis TaxID=657419 RepID=A0ABQ1ID26_9PROT|nr:aromatic ring-hydroxylating dioxygenase subunit alpha [Tistrella bauzanensis]GGB34189.1 (2Fe-2S) ferredoxin [Tistrella bauzanensis]